MSSVPPLTDVAAQFAAQVTAILNPVTSSYSSQSSYKEEQSGQAVLGQSYGGKAKISFASAVATSIPTQTPWVLQNLATASSSTPITL